MAQEVLQVLNKPGNVEGTIRRVIEGLRRRAGFDAIGIRLRSGEDFPYLAAEGFSDDFLRAGDFLLARDGSGQVCRDKEGLACLECTCGLVLSGHAGPGKDAMLTPGGTFWTNDSRALLDLPSDQDPRFRPRNRCIHEGYASVALVPIRDDEQVVGLIQANCLRRDAFALEAVEILESIGSHVGAALRRKRDESDLRSSLLEKEALLKEVHHRVKNNLQVITSLLRLETRRHPLPETQRVLIDMQGRIQSMALLHESLYRSGNFATVDLAAYVAHLAGQSFRAQGITAESVVLDLALTPVSVTMERAVPCGLLVNELLSNALKHGFPPGRRGRIRVDLRVAGLEAVLSVTDDGVGLPADFDARRQHSLGLQLVADLARQLGGRLEIGPKPQATFTVTFATEASLTGAVSKPQVPG